MDVITQLVAYLSKSIPDIPILNTIPRNRPKAFIFIERIGGAVDEYRELPSVMISTWSVSEKASENMALEVIEKMKGFKYEPHICKCECNSFVPMPDPETNTPRHQMLYNLITTY